MKNKRNHYYIYAHFNIFNGKVYVGETKQSPPSRRWKNGKAYKTSTYFNNAIKKYGWNSFIHIILEECDCDNQELKNKENFWINVFDSRNPKCGYNINKGGYENLSPLAKEKAEEWKRNHPEVMIERANAMHKWQREHPEEMLRLRQINSQKATNARKRAVICIETGEIFESASDAARNINGTSQSKINMVCNGKRNTCGGYHWRYVNG